MDGRGLLLKSSVLHLDHDSRAVALQDLAFLGLHRYLEVSGEVNVNESVLKALVIKASAEFDEMIDNKRPSMAANYVARRMAPTPTGNTKSPIKTIPRPDATEHYPFADSVGSVFDVLKEKTESNYLVMGAPAQKRFASKVFEEFRFEKKGLKIKDIPEALKSIGLPVSPALAKACAGPDAKVISDPDNPEENRTDINKYIKLQEWLNLLDRYICRSSTSTHSAKEANKGATSSQKKQSGVESKKSDEIKENDGNDNYKATKRGDIISSIASNIEEVIQKPAQNVLKVRDTHTTKMRKVQSRIGEQLRRDKIAWAKAGGVDRNKIEASARTKIDMEANRRRLEHFATSSYLLEEKTGKTSSKKKSNNDSLLPTSQGADSSVDETDAMKITHKFLKSDVGRLFAMGDYPDRFESVNTSSSQTADNSYFDESSTISEINLLSAKNYAEGRKSSESTARAPSLNQLDRDHPSIALKAVRLNNSLDKDTLKAISTRNNSTNNDFDEEPFGYRVKSTRNGWVGDFGKPSSVFFKRTSRTDESSNNISSTSNSSNDIHLSSSREEMNGWKSTAPSRGRGRGGVSASVAVQSDSADSSGFTESLGNSLALNSAV